jgi:hypothetical protein
MRIFFHLSKHSDSKFLHIHQGVTILDKLSLARQDKFMSLPYKIKRELYNYLKQCQAQFQTHPQGSQSGVWIQPAEKKQLNAHLCQRRARS